MSADTHPVAFFVFNRPAVTKIVFDRIRQARPPVLMLIGDGPRHNRAGESDACRQVRQIVERVAWPCEVLKNYSDTNLGCGARVASGLDWVFQQVEEAIILEDDCLPDSTFFRFCSELLERYRDEQRVMQIAGSNLLFGRRATDDSYYFSRYSQCWGWATWRRAWRHFDFDMHSWKENREACLAKFTHNGERAFWQHGWDSIAAKRLDTWDYQWSLSVLNANGLSITPAVNLVSNLGFGFDATHTRSRLLALHQAARAMEFPLRHPRQIERNCTADAFTARRAFYRRSRVGKAAEIVRRRVLAALSRVQTNRYRLQEIAVTTESSLNSK
jgi:hypothetical protein